MQHRPTVITGRKASIGFCSCGWTGEDRQYITEARFDANDHAIASARARATDPAGATAPPPTPKQK